jgi:hypothetical protein
MDCGEGASGRGDLGDTCRRDADCQSGMYCSDDFCSLGSAPSSKVSDDDEAPRFFVRLGLAPSMAWVKEGMRADREPPRELIYSPEIGVDGEGRWLVDQNSTPRDNTPWIPDGDTHLPNGMPIGGECAGDGNPSHPSGMLDGMPVSPVPTSYCVRVNSPGFVANVALRSEIGYWVLPRLALAGVLRFQFDSGQGQLANILLGARAEYLLTQPVVTGLMLSVFGGGTFGQIQAQPPSQGGSGGAPYVETGLAGVHFGGSLRYRLSRNFGLHASPEINILFPAFLFAIDTTFGVEVAF